MERYNYFDNIFEFKLYLSSLKPQKIGEGSEGEAFLTKDNDVIKIFNGPSKPNVGEEEKGRIIMAQDYNVSCYLLPTELLICDGKIIGYRSSYFPNNIIKYRANYNGDINEIDFKNLLKAREKMIKDTKLLTKNGILVYDLAFNLLFDNTRLGAIDTFGYQYDPSVTLEDNVANIDYAILHELHFHDLRFEPNYKESIEYNLKRVKK